MWKQTNKLPAWISLTDKSIPVEAIATPEEVNALKDIIGHNFTINRMELDGRHLHIYRAKQNNAGSNDKNDIIVKWTCEEGEATAYDVHSIAQWLYEQGVSTPRTLCKPQKAVFLGDRGILCSLDYMEHNLLGVTKADLSALALSLVKLHEVLPSHPSVNIWALNTNNRFNKLSEMRSFLMKGVGEFGPLPQRLYDIANNLKLDFFRKDLPVQCLHGDMNYRNAFVSKNNKSELSVEVTLLDFEDVVHSVLPLEFELALVIERFITVHNISQDNAIDIANCFLSTYTKNCTNTPNFQKVNWLNIIQSLHLRSLCVLSLIESENGKVPDEEWHKFFYLFDRAEQQSHVWDSLGC